MCTGLADTEHWSVTELPTLTLYVGARILTCGASANKSVYHIVLYIYFWTWEMKEKWDLYKSTGLVSKSIKNDGFNQKYFTLKDVKNCSLKRIAIYFVSKQILFEPVLETEMIL